METTAWELIKGAMSLIVLPLLAAFSYFFRKNLQDVEILKVKISDLNIKQAVSESQIKDIREDIKHLADLIKEVEATIVGDIKDLQKDIRGQHDKRHYPLS